jgi:hypothetical protein
MSKYPNRSISTACGLAAFLLVAGLACLTAMPARAQAGKPNILVIFGDDIG